MTCRRSCTLWLLLAVFLVHATPQRVSAGGIDIAGNVGDWLDWIKGKVTGKLENLPEPSQPEPEQSWECQVDRGAETCIIRPGEDGPDASTLHKLLRYPTAEQLAVRQQTPLRVIITGGAYVSIPLTIPNNTHITVEQGASLVFDAADAELYALWVAEALPTYGKGLDAGGPLRYRAHLDCDGCRNVTIDGEGIIDGGGDRWWDMWEARQSGDDTAAEFLSKDRPPLLEFRSCSDVAIRDVTLRNSPWWTLHPWNCSRMLVEGVTIQSLPNRPAAHTIVVDSSRDVQVADTTIFTGGDCIALQSGLDTAGRQWRRPTFGIQLQNVTCSAPSGAALRIGPELTGGIQDVVATGWTVGVTRDAILLATSWGRGGYVRDLTLDGWAVSNATADVLRIDTRLHGRQAGWDSTSTANISMHDFALEHGSRRPHVRAQGGLPMWLRGFSVERRLTAGASCWSAVWVGGVCRAAPGFIMFLWFVAILAGFVMLLGISTAGGWYAWRHIKAWKEKRRRMIEDLADEEDTLDLETIELINLEHRRAAQMAVEESLEDPSHSMRQGRTNGLP